MQNVAETEDREYLIIPKPEFQLVEAMDLVEHDLYYLLSVTYYLVTVNLLINQSH